MPTDREKYYSAAPISKGTPKRILKARKKREHAMSVSEIREYVMARERNVCRCCRKRRAESMHELKFRSQGGKPSRKNSVGVCGDGVRGCHGFLQRHEIEWFTGPYGAEETVTFWPNKSQAACDWLAIKIDESIESAPMREMEAEI